MVYFTEKLINEIRKRSCIWDTADMNHLNKEVLANTWMEIGENLYSDWHVLSAFDQRDRVADVKKKWTNIKDSFVKDVKGKKPRKSRGPPEHRKKYYLFDHLQFLIPFIQDPKGVDGRSAEGGGESTKKKIRKSLGEGTSSSSSSSRAHAAATVTETTAAGKPEMPPDVQQHADLLNNFAGKSASDALCHLDDDLSFLLSVLPTIKSLNERQKINFKIGVLQVLASLKFNEVLQHPAAADAGYQPFATPDLRCFPVPYQPNIPFPFISQAAAVSSTQHQQHAHAAAAPAMKLETVNLNSPSSSYFDTDDDDSNH